MSVGIIIASHGGLAEGLLNSATMIFGQQNEVEIVSLLPKEGPEDVAQKLRAAVEKLAENDKILFLVDLWGGTVSNQSNAIIEAEEKSMGLIAGVNLPMVITAFAMRLQTGMSLEELMTAIVGETMEAVKTKPTLVEAKPQQKVEQAASNLDEIAKLNKTIDYGLVRIDSRLLHGQVVTGWVRDVQPNRILVVSDAVSKDAMRKELIVEAAPSGIPANVIPVDKFIEISKDKRFGNVKALVLFENPSDVVRAMEGGVDFKEVNVGSMAHSKNKHMVNNVLSMDQNDVNDFIYMRDNGVKFDVRKVPADSKNDLFPQIKKIKELTVN